MFVFDDEAQRPRVEEAEAAVEVLAQRCWIRRIEPKMIPISIKKLWTLKKENESPLLSSVVVSS